MPRLWVAFAWLGFVGCQSPLTNRPDATNSPSPDDAAPSAADAARVDAQAPAPFTQPYTCDSDTISLHHFDGNGADECGSANLDGTLSFAAAQSPQFGMTAEFSGGGDRLRSAEGFDIGSAPFTVEAWINLAAMPGVSSYGFIAAVNDGTPGSMAWYVAVTASGKLAIAKTLSDCTTLDPDGGVLTSQRAIELDQWTHFSASYDGQGYIVKINGASIELVAYSPDASLCQTSATPLTVGNAGNSTQSYTGQIDELRISSVLR